MSGGVERSSHSTFGALHWLVNWRQPNGILASYCADKGGGGASDNEALHMEAHAM